MELVEYVLKNGAPLIIAPRKETCVAQILVGFNVGSEHDVEGKRGLSHFCEHMSFRGGERYPSSEVLVKKIEMLGGVPNAFTNHIATWYSLVVPFQNLYSAMDVLSEMTMHSFFKEENIEKEKEIILRELDRYVTNNQNDFSLLGRVQMFPKTSIEHTPLGLREDIRSFTREDLIGFHNTFYTGANMIVVITGNVDVEKVRQKADELFSDLHEGVCASLPLVSPSRENRVCIVKKDIEQCFLRFVFPSVVSGDRREIFLDAASFLLGGASSSRITLRVRENMGAAYDIDGYNMCPETAQYGFVEFFVATSVDRVEEVARAVCEEITRFKKEGVSEEEIEIFVNKYVYELFTNTEPADRHGEHLFFSYLRDGCVRTIQEQEQEIRGVKKEDVQRVAQEFFTTENMFINIVGNGKDVATLEKEISLLGVS